MTFKKLSCLRFTGVNGFGSEQVTFEIIIVGRSTNPFGLFDRERVLIYPRARLAFIYRFVFVLRKTSKQT